jgi:hypothetical protein
MDQSVRIVTNLPLRELWGANGFITTSRSRSLSEEDISALLRVGPVEFVVVDVGLAPRWIHLEDSHRFWKTEVKPHLAADAKAVLADFPHDYCYFASQWDGGESAPPVVVLEKSH